MRKALALFLAPLALVVGLAVPPKAEAHTSQDIVNICTVLDVGLGGPEYNYVGTAYRGQFHYYGLHYAQCCFYDLRNGARIYALYLIGYGNLTYPQNDPWCR